MTRPAESTRSRGAAGEERAASWLAASGWVVRERNFRAPSGEIDIIAEKGGEVAFVEVKAWSAMPEAELEHAIDRRKQQRIVRTARYYLSRQPRCAGMRLRFDVVFIDAATSRLRHIENAFNGGID
ncbi:MAG TPA: YraN family protein [Spirochaetia bacterium]|nr:YraN family protein [Spirochaetia bacterium]